MILIHPLFDPVILSFGIFEIRWYGLAYVLGFLLGIYYIKLFNKKFKNSINNNYIDDFFIWSVLWVIIGGRLGYVLFYQTSSIFVNPINILYIWLGGMSFHGGLIGIIISIYFFCINKTKIFFDLTDLISLVAPIGIFFGRIANFINGELIGKPTELPWAVVFPMYDEVARHPSQIYEALLEGLLLFVILNIIIKKKDYYKGKIAALFLLLYSVLRLISEFFREPDLQVGYIFNLISMGSLLSFLTFAVGLIMYLKLR